MQIAAWASDGCGSWSWNDAAALSGSCSQKTGAMSRLPANSARRRSITLRAISRSSATSPGEETKIRKVSNGRTLLNGSARDNCAPTKPRAPVDQCPAARTRRRRNTRSAATPANASESEPGSGTPVGGGVVPPLN